MTGNDVVESIIRLRVKNTGGTHLPDEPQLIPHFHLEFILGRFLQFQLNHHGAAVAAPFHVKHAVASYQLLLVDDLKELLYLGAISPDQARPPANAQSAR